MNKSTYYVSVHGRSVLNEQGASAYEWEIQATSEEAEQLRMQLELLQEQEEEDFTGLVFPWPDTPEAETNARFQGALDEVYRSIHRLGSAQTRALIEEYRLMTPEQE